MTRTSTFIVATLAAITAASLAPTAASARGGGHAASGGFSGPAVAGEFGRGPVAHGIGNVSNNAFGKTGKRFPSFNQIAHLPPHHITVNTPSHTPTQQRWHRYGMGGVGLYGDDCVAPRYLPNGRVVYINVCSQDM